ncbi:MAG: DUF1877 family protein [Halieaceae bacterium]|jgi:hypothetical protein|nr:DUF1877 family protein [Halieaceae bacterium]
MSCLGLHFALSAADVETLLSINDGTARLEYLQEELEERYFEESKEYLAESDKAWDAMHRVLADGSLTWEGGSYPLNHAVLAGKLIYTQPDYIMSLKEPAQVSDIAAALEGVAKSVFRERYDVIDPQDYGLPLSDEDFNYTWEWFQNVRELYRRAADEERHVLFTADQ